MPPKASGKLPRRQEKPQKNISKGDGKKRKHKRKESYAIYILQGVEAALLVLPTTTRGPPSLSEIQNCSASPPSWRVGPKHAVSEGTKAVTKYTSSK
ncbi:Histone H2B.3 [Orchesella cincta]|uniref:Histone H2B.3 n=1 Tax=Orchesella cincta TaxID=48709 RepID=A0A1D2M8Z4_ORCCI|nr:Histone H2B.3 [Orchesella cincta]